MDGFGLLYPIDRDRYYDLVDFLHVVSGCGWSNAEQAVCGYVLRFMGDELGRRYDEAALHSRPCRGLGTEVDVIAYDEFADMGCPSIPVSVEWMQIFHLNERYHERPSEVEAIEDGIKSRWWTAQSVVMQGKQTKEISPCNWR